MFFTLVRLNTKASKALNGSTMRLVIIPTTMERQDMSIKANSPGD